MFESIPIVDNHAHPLLRWEAAAREPFSRFFTEGHDHETATVHARTTLFYRTALVELAAFFGCAPTEEEVLKAREARRDDYLRAMAESVQLSAVLIDDGYPRDDALTVAEMASALGAPAHRVLRVESLVEDLLPSTSSLQELEDALVRALDEARPGLAALKTIIAYRCGLDFATPSRSEVEAALPAAREDVLARRGRLRSQPVLVHALLLAAQWAAREDLPIQVHTGFGDRDLDLRLANPLHLRPHIEDSPLSRPRLVLLHAGYPFVREAAYLASVYPAVSVDFSAAAPLLAGPGLTRVLEELLSLAPVSKVLYGSDAWAIGEWFWLAARAARRSLAEALAWLPPQEQERAARLVLGESARELYRLPG